MVIMVEGETIREHDSECGKGNSKHTRGLMELSTVAMVMGTRRRQEGASSFPPDLLVPSLAPC